MEMTGYFDTDKLQIGDQSNQPGLESINSLSLGVLTHIVQYEEENDSRRNALHFH
jgi:hypothetical protein